MEHPSAQVAELQSNEFTATRPTVGCEPNEKKVLLDKMAAFPINDSTCVVRDSLEHSRLRSSKQSSENSCIDGPARRRPCRASH